MRVGVLASGSGSNFQALVDALNREGSPARVTCLFCNVPGAKVLERAATAGIEAVAIDHTGFPSRESFDAHLANELGDRDVELICLAGYMRLVTSALLSRFPWRVVNVHPALLPAFPGLHAPRQALTAGVAVSGCTVHFVDEGTDTGPIIAQAVVPVQPDDDEATLTARIQKEEHRLFPAVVREIAKGTISVEGRRVKRPGVIA